jgi:hypothetical protein
MEEKIENPIQELPIQDRISSEIKVEVAPIILPQ